LLSAPWKTKSPRGQVKPRLGVRSGHSARRAVSNANRFGSDPYAKEELTAELGAAFLCGHCGILPRTEENSAAYLKGWLERLKAEPSMLIKAGSESQRAYDFILNQHEVKAPVVMPAASNEEPERKAA
jgi:antirestriction protein ArdC